MTEETVAKVETTETETETNWSDPMLKQVAQLKDMIIAGHRLRQRVAQLEATNATMQSILNEREAERIELRTRVKIAEDTAKAATDESEQLRANLDYEKELFATLNREHDELKEAHRMLLEDHEKARDERDVAVLDREETQRQRDNVALRLMEVSTDLDASRSQWFKQEDDLQRSLREATAERNSFEEKFRKCKSLAASMMALDQVKPVAEEPQYN
jgi:chromosome segregation ATPase